MKKILFNTLSLVLILSIILQGCSDSVPAVKPVESLEEAEEISSEAEEADVVLISDILNKSGTFTDDETKEEIPYCYRIPEIMSQSQDAERINKEIQQTVLKIAQSALLDIKSGNSPKERYINYETSFKDDIVSIVIDGDLSQKYIYNFDFAEEKALSSTELLNALKIEEEDFNKSLKSSVLNLFDDGDDDVKEKAASLSKKNLSLHNIDVYLSNETLNARVPVSEKDGTVYNEYISVDPFSESTFKEVSCGNLKARLKGNKAEIIFLEGKNLNISDTIEFDTPYAVEGLFSTYNDIYLFKDDKSSIPALFLLSDEGEIAFCDIPSSALCTNRFFAEDKIAGLKGITSLEQGEKSGRKTVFAVNKDGERIDIYDSLVAFRLFRTEEMTEDALWAADEGNCILSFKESGMTLKVSDSDDLYEGTFFFSGLTEKGYVFPFMMENKSKDKLSGFITVPYDMEENEYQNIVITFADSEKDSSLTFYEYSEFEENPSKISVYEELSGTWVSADKKTSLTLANDKSAVFTIQNEQQDGKTIYEGTWKADENLLSLSLEFSSGQSFEKNNHMIDYLEGSYTYIKGLNSTLVITPDKKAFPLAESQKIIRTFPEIFKLLHTGDEDIENEESEDMEDLKESAVEYAVSQGIKANSADLSAKTDEGILIRVYLSDEESERTKAWYMIDPETKKGKNLFNKKSVDLNSLI